MKSLLSAAIIAGATSLFIYSCSTGDNSATTDREVAADYSAVINQFVDGTVLPTYESLKNEATLLFGYVKHLDKSRTQATLDSACKQWVATRKPWEQGEAFLFGPAEFKSLDPLLDSWPLDENQLAQVMASDKVELTPDYVREGLGHVLRGFHTIEFLLFKDEKERAVADIDDREYEYLLAVTQVLRDDAITLWALWHGSEGIAGTDEEVLEALEIDAGTGYAAEFRNAGRAGSRYASQNSAIGEIIEGCLGIADELGNMKLAEPYKSKDPLRVESQFSYNSLVDFCDNVESIRNVLFGGIPDKRNPDASLIATVAGSAPELEETLEAALDEAITAIRAIPEPFRNNLDKTGAIDNAIAKTGALTGAIEALRSAIYK